MAVLLLFVQKLLQFTITILAFVGTAIFINPSFVLTTSQLWIVISAMVLVLGSQPSIKLSDLVASNDSASMLLILFSAICTVNMAMIEFSLNADGHINSWTLVGILIMVVGLIIRIIAINQLHDFFTNTVSIRQNHRIIKTGFYAIVRHPSYTGSLLVFYGLPVLLQSWLSLPFSIILTYLAYHNRIKIEERCLIEHFGEMYQVYKNNTGTLFPLLNFKKDGHHS